MKRTGLALALALTLSAGAWAQNDNDAGPQDVLFRYTDGEGRQVVRQSIPPEAAPRGYEIINKSGRVIRTVAPAPKGADAAKMVEKMRREAQLEEWDTHLKRRYSTVKDIEAAKQRALSELEGNLSILRANRSGVKSQLEDQQRRAAVMERAGREVSATVLKNIENLESELEDIAEQIEQRRAEIEAEARSYDEDIARFEKISR